MIFAAKKREKSDIIYGIIFSSASSKEEGSCCVDWAHRDSCHAPQLSLLELVAHVEKESSCRSGADTTTTDFEI